MRARSRKRTAARRTAKVRSNCRFTTTLTARKRGRYAIAVRFAGSRTLLARSARAVTVRAG